MTSLTNDGASTPHGKAQATPSLAKCRTGIAGLDEITSGGLPAGRPTLVCGSAGSGKTLLGIEFLVRGASTFGEPGVFVSFEERPEDLNANVASLGFDLPGLIRDKKLIIDHVRVEREQIAETGEYDLEGLFIRLDYAIRCVGARRVVLDTLESLFAGLSNTAVIRSELNRLFRWLKDRGISAVITAERGDGQLTRHGLEEYISDCVILLDHRMQDQVSTRRLRIIKYRGSAHGTNEYPFLIDERGFSVMPITSLGLDHACSSERVSTGVPRLDAMLGGKGFYRGSSVLLTGTPGTGKTSLACQLVRAACARGERCLYFAFEESPAQICRNMRSIGIDLDVPVQAGELRFQAARPTHHGIEMHLVQMHRHVVEFKPQVVVIDPISNLQNAGTTADASSAMLRLVDYLKSQGVTAFYTSLTHNGGPLEQTDLSISSLMDTWLLLRDVEHGGERNRALYVLKSRGMAHSNQVREFILTGQGIELVDVYTGPGGVLTGSARLTQEAVDRGEALGAAQEVERRQRELARKHAAIEARVAALRATFASEQEDLTHAIEQARARKEQVMSDRHAMALSRKSPNGQITPIAPLTTCPTPPPTTDGNSGAN